MFLKFICCDVFARMACDLVARSPHIVDIEFVPMMAHVDPNKLRSTLAAMIESSIEHSNRHYDALLLGFGLCGNAVVGLSSPIPMVIPRAHDCCTIHMGSKQRFLEVFGSRLSTRWGSTGYHERAFVPNSGYYQVDQLENHRTSKAYMDLVEQYGEEDADYVWETMHPKVESKDSIYIRIDGYEHSAAYEHYKARMEQLGIDLSVVDGSTSLLADLVNGEWDDERFLTVGPGQRIAGVYDMDQVMRAADSLLQETSQ